MALNQLGLGFVFTAKDLASGVIGRVKEKFGELENKTASATKLVESNFAQFGKGLAIFGGGVATVGGAFALAEKADEFVKALEQAGAAANASSAEMEAMRGAAVQVALKGTGTSAESAADALRELVFEGYSAKSAIAALGPTLSLVSISLGQLSRGQAAGLVNDTLGQFKLGAEAAGPLVDKLALAMRTFGLRARELEPAMRGVATGVSLTNASLDDTIIALGLTKSVLPSVEQSARSVNLAFNQLASDKTRKELGALGIKVADSGGKMRPLIDILGDLSRRTARMTEAQRAHAMASIFSARAGGGLTVIMDALKSGVRGASGQLVTGAAAIDELRAQMAGASGTAQQMKDRLLDTFAGQKKALSGVLSTLGTLIGEPFTMVFKPIVAAIRDAFLAIARFIAAIPAPVKKFLAQIVVAAGGIATMVGTFIAAKAGIALLVIGLKTLGITVGGVLLTMLPFLAIFGLLAAVVWGFTIAFKRDMGGLGDFVKNVATKAKLAFRGLAQLFTEGGFSGAVMQELGRAENQGLKRFVINVYAIVYRLGRIWEGFKEGFKAAIEAAAPVFRDFVDSLRELGGELGGVFGGITKSAAGLPSEKFRAFGAIAGSALAAVVSGFVKLWAIANRIASGIAGAWRTMMEYVGPAFDTLKGALSDLSASWRELWGSEQSTSQAAGASTSSWRSVGEVLAKVVGGAITVIVLALSGLMKVLNAVVWVVTKVKDAFVYVGTLIGETAAKIYLWFTEDIPRALRTAWAWIKGVFVGIGNFFAGIGRWFAGIWQGIADGVRSFIRPIVEFFQSIVDGIRNMLDRMTAYVGKLAAKIPARFRPANMEAMIEAGKAAESRIAERAARAVAPVAATVVPSGAAALTPGSAVRAGEALGSAAAEAAMPGVAEVRARGELSDAELNAIVARGLALSEGRPVQAHVTLNVDGETLARVSAKADRNAAARSFMPVPVPG